MEKEKKRPSSIGWVLGQAGPHRKELWLAVFFALMGVVFAIAPYFVIIRIIRNLMDGNGDVSFYMNQCGIMAAIWVARSLLHSVSTSISHRATFATLGEMRKRCTDKLARMPLGDILNRNSGALKNTLIERIDSIETTLAHIIPEFTANLLIPVGILIYIFFIDWRMGLASILTIPVGLVCYMMMMAGSEEPYMRTLNATKALNDTAVEYINGIQVIKVFGKTKNSYERFTRDANEAAHSFIDWMRDCIIPFTFAMVIMPSNLISVLPIGGILMQHGMLSAEDFISVLILSVGLITPLVTLMGYSDDIRTMATIFGQVREIQEAPEMERAAVGAVPAGNDLKLSGVRFSYGDTEVLHGVDMDIPEGSFVALVGPSGSGKSTIARLIASLWDVDAGSITLGGTDIKNIPQEICADRVAFVSQDNYLFNMTIRENIRLGRADATDAEVEEAAKKSGCHDFIMSLEKGYDTMVGSSGGHLSGGERQRISIARAMLKAAPVVILDEATAYTDPENEAVIQRSVSKLTEGKTLIVIAHRLSTIVDADRIYVVKDGLIAEQGTHDELLRKDGIYGSMWKAHISSRDELKGGEE